MESYILFKIDDQNNSGETYGMDEQTIVVITFAILAIITVAVIVIIVWWRFEDSKLHN